jgi:polyisoprenoid-binding protein YceI
MKKIISIIVLIVVVILVIVYIGKKPADVKVPVNTVDNSGVVSGIKIPKETYVYFNLADKVYAVNPADAKVTWTGRKVVLKNWIDSGTIALKEGAFEVKGDSVVLNKFVFDMTSIAAMETGSGKGQDMLSKHLKSADFFDVEKFPTATFIAKDVMPNGTSTTKYTVKGDMTIKGITKEISIPVTIDRTNPGTTVAKGSVDLDRTLWDIKYGSDKFFKGLGDNIIDDIFNISFEIKLNTNK